MASAGEPVLLYRITDVPALIAGEVAPADPIRERWFFVANAGSPALRHAFAVAPEPDAGDGAEARWISVASLVARGLERAGALDPLDAWSDAHHGVTGKHTFGFHAGDPEVVLAALRQAGAEVLEAAPVLAALRWFTADRDELWLREIDGERVTLTPLRSVRARPADGPGERPLYAVRGPAPGRRVSLHDRSGHAATLGAAPPAGDELLFGAAPPRPAPAVDAALHRDALAIALEELGGAWATSAPAIRVLLREGAPGRALVRLETIAPDGDITTTSEQLVIAPRGPAQAAYTPARYRALLRAVRARLEREGGAPTIAQLFPLLLLEDAALTTEDEFGAALYAVEVAAHIVARRAAATWRARGVTGPPTPAHGLLALAWFELATHLELTADELVLLQARHLAALHPADAASLIAAARAAYRGYLTGDALEPPTGMIVAACLAQLDELVQ